MAEGKETGPARPSAWHRDTSFLNPPPPMGRGTSYGHFKRATNTEESQPTSPAAIFSREGNRELDQLPFACVLIGVFDGTRYHSAGVMNRTNHAIQATLFGVNARVCCASVWTRSAMWKFFSNGMFCRADGAKWKRPRWAVMIQCSVRAEGLWTGPKDDRRRWAERGGKRFVRIIQCRFGFRRGTNPEQPSPQGWRAWLRDIGPGGGFSICKGVIELP